MSSCVFFFFAVLVVADGVCASAAIDGTGGSREVVAGSGRVGRAG